DPLIRLWAQFVTDFVRREINAVDDGTDRAAWASWKKEVRRLLSSPEAASDRVARGALFELWSNAIELRHRRPIGEVDQVADTARRGKIGTEQLELLVEMADRQEV